jgi:hypothetical protein
MHAKLALKWWRDACRHTRAGNTDTAADFLKMIDTAQENEARALDDAMDAKLKAARMEGRAELFKAMAGIVDRSAA